MSRSFFLSSSCEVAFSRSSLFLQAGRRFCLFVALFGAPAGSPWFEVSPWHRGIGRRLIVGPLLVEVGHG